MKKSILLVLIYLILLCPGCGKPEIEIMENDILKVSVSTNGRVYVEGRRVSLKHLKTIFQELKEKNGEVWYHRENAQADKPPQQANQVIDMVIAAKLPVSLSSKPDFSDYIDEYGHSHPRVMPDGFMN